MSFQGNMDTKASPSKDDLAMINRKLELRKSRIQPQNVLLKKVIECVHESPNENIRQKEQMFLRRN